MVGLECMPRIRRSPPRPAADPSPKARAVRVPRPPRRRRRSLYASATRFQRGALDDLIPELLSVVAPHVEALQAVSHPLALLLGERLRRSLCRLEPLLDETLSELKALKDADVAVAACTANLRDSMKMAQSVLSQHGVGGHKVDARLGDDEFLDDVSPRILKLVENWEAHLQRLVSSDAQSARTFLAENMRALVEAKHSELRARMVLEDTHGVLRHALAELTTVGRACERAFPEVAENVVARPLQTVADDEPLGLFDIQ